MMYKILLFHNDDDDDDDDVDVYDVYDVYDVFLLVDYMVQMTQNNYF